MLTTVEVRNEQGSVLTLPLRDVSAGYLIKEIEGLNPVKATIVSSDFALMDGARYQSSRREPRNIVMKLGFAPDYVLGTVQELRSRLYGYFMPKSSVNLSFLTNNNPTVDIPGRIESFETALFTQDPEVIVSIMCFNPDFFEPDPVIVAGSTVSDGTLMVIDYLGSVETGIIFRMAVDRVLTEFTLYSSLPDGSLSTFEFAAALTTGDALTLNMLPGSKAASLMRAGVSSSVLYGVAPFANWIKLYPGVNNIRVYSGGAAVPFTIEYTNKFGGL